MAKSKQGTLLGWFYLYLDIPVWCYWVSHNLQWKKPMILWCFPLLKEAWKDKGKQLERFVWNSSWVKSSFCWSAARMSQAHMAITEHMTRPTLTECEQVIWLCLYFLIFLNELLKLVSKSGTWTRCDLKKLLPANIMDSLLRSWKHSYCDIITSKSSSLSRKYKS